MRPGGTWVLQEEPGHCDLDGAPSGASGRGSLLPGQGVDDVTGACCEHAQTWDEGPRALPQTEQAGSGVPFVVSSEHLSKEWTQPVGQESLML